MYTNIKLSAYQQWVYAPAIQAAEAVAQPLRQELTLAGAVLDNLDQQLALFQQRYAAQVVLDAEQYRKEAKRHEW
jgi:hypothetical protein